MKTLALVAFTAAALAVPTLASAAEQSYYNPPDNTFISGNLNVAPAANSDAARYTQTVTYFEPSDGTFVTTKVGAAPTIATHDAVKTSGAVLHLYQPNDGTFVDVPVGN
ncbi:hypothetical protein [Pleomorphomonas koreensis]|uniref:hypothetical protein n=1 Tax=Pleomorphomonas koreensis TaxID=257440 RepID=UPI000406C59C|nr:hypothetical protein [Pleomorphomonas koreensis]